ncbi:MAG: macrocin-O-methyltransferase [Agathobacter sp.]|nr:macrocin-O-methyltransferase [Agathobacter sp.]
MTLLIFGAGYYGMLYKKYLEQYSKEDNIIGFLDNGNRDVLILSKNGDAIPIYSPEAAVGMDYDRIVVTTSNPVHIHEISEQLKELNVPLDKIEFLYKNEELRIKVIASYNMYNEEDARVRWLRNFSIYAKEKGLTGNVAECGVFKGEFAYFINKYFSDRKLYLFDTFEGFQERDLEIERTLDNNAFLEGSFNSEKAFVSGNEKVTLERMLFKDNCIVKKGYFPETAVGIEDEFCFVNLDMDLYLPTLEGLRFYYDRMCKGGVVLIHDYYHPELPGIKQAIKDFELETKQELVKLPIGDFCSIAIVKN